MDLLADAVYRTIHDFKDAAGSRGATALASLVNMNPGTLNNKANPGMEDHQLSLRESIAVQRTTNDYRILNSYNAILGFASFRLGNFEGVADIEVLEAYTRVNKEMGDMASEIHQALSDRCITKKEFIKIQRESMETIQAIFELMHRVEAITDEK